jgi:hypothetical protein
MVPAIILFIGLFFFPKSPRWLAAKGRWDEARQVLADLHGDGDMSHPVVLAEFMEIEEVLRLEREAGQTSWAEMAQPRIAKRVFLGCSVQMFSQLTGMNVMSISPFHSSPHAFLSCMLLNVSVLYCICHARSRRYIGSLDFLDSICPQRCHDRPGNHSEFSKYLHLTK